LARATLSNSPRDANRKPSLQLVLVGEFVLALVCCAAVAASATGGRLLLPALVFIGFLLVALLGSAAGLAATTPCKDPPRNPSAWHALFYSDREDPALFVPKRRGFGYTVNVGHPAALPVMLLILLVPLAIGITAALLVR
jgi:hypothetical protein